MSISPRYSRAPATSSRTPFSVLTSPGWGYPPISCATAVAASKTRSLTTTRAPAAASPRASARPIPAPAPVTTTPAPAISIATPAGYRDVDHPIKPAAPALPPQLLLSHRVGDGAGTGPSSTHPRREYYRVADGRRGMIEVERLSKHFGPVAAVDDLSFTVRPGRVTGFLGPNGAGKTTTMRIILGLAAPTSGRALVGGRRYDGLIRPLREVGSLLDATALHAGRTAWAHLWSIAQANGITRPRVTEVLGLTGLESVARRRVGGFSLGMKQRLGIAAALLGDPPVLMFDEPVNGLDPE